MNSFIQQALIFIGAAVILVPIFQRLGFGSVLGYLLAGIIVGPYGLKLIQDAESIMHFSELGVILLLFMIGLEIQPHKLWSMRRKLLGLGGFQVILTTVIFMVIGINMGLSVLAAGVIGFGLSLSSTAFAVQSLVEKNQFNTEFGRSSFSILLMQDLFAIPALAIIPVLNGRSPAAEPAHSGNAFLGLGLIFALVVAGRFVFRPMFRWLAKNRSREIFTAATLFIVLGVSALMLQVGLSAALGTFIAGVLLADSEFRHELEADLEPFKSLLLGLFFIAVGMGVNLSLIVERPIFIFGLAVGYLLIKMLVIYGAGRISRMNHENSKQMALTIAQGGEFAFVIFGLVTQMSLAPNEMLSALTVVITLSMAINPLLTMFNERLCGLARKNRVQPQYDQIKDESPEIIIAGFGRFGQIFGRILRAQNIPFVAIDHDADQIELLRKFGSKVYYGDASRMDILEAAGAGKAKFFVLAIDDVEMSLATAKVVSENFKNLKVFARARNRGHAFDLMALGIMTIKRELLDSSVFFTRDLLLALGIDPKRATKIIERFRVHDEIMFEQQFKVRNDDIQFVDVAKRGQALLEQVLADDTTQSHIAPPAPPVSPS